MRDFFKGWKRKLGVVTLVMACVLTVGWVRSYAKFDLIFLPPVCIVVSTDGDFAISQEVRLRSQIENGGTIELSFESTAFLSRPKFLSRDRGQSEIIQPRMIPYPAIVLPLTLLSAWLLLSKRRTVKTPEPSQSPELGHA